MRLTIRPKFYPISIAKGIRLAYRRNQSAGSWTVLAGGWTKPLGAADDHEPANGTTVLSFDQAVATARQLARGTDAGDVEGGRPVTVAEAVAGYARELKATGRRVGNATRVAYHLTAALGSKPVGLLTPRDSRGFRDLLRAKGLTISTVLRTMKVFAAALSFAAKDDKRVTNKSTWKVEALQDSTVARGPLWILTEPQAARVVQAAYTTGGERFGLYVEVLATFGCRPAQARRIVVGDLEPEHDRLQMPSSLKGKGRLRIDHEPLPVPHGLALRLAAEAAGRDANEPLLRDDDGGRYSDARPTPDRWQAAAAAAKLPTKPKTATKREQRQRVGAYSLRHTSIARNLLRGPPAALVARMHDTSEVEIRRHYGRYITHTDSAQDIMRAALPSFDAPLPATVVPLRRPKR